MEVFTSLQIEFWCMDPAFVDKLAKENNGEKHLQIRQVLFDRTVDAKGKKRFEKDCESVFNHDYKEKSFLVNLA